MIAFIIYLAISISAFWALCGLFTYAQDRRYIPKKQRLRSIGWYILYGPANLFS